MDDDDAIPPPIHRSRGAAPGRRTPVNDAWVEDEDFPSIDSASSRQHQAPRFNPLAAHPIAAANVTDVSPDDDVQSIIQSWAKLKPFHVASPPPTPPAPHRSPARLKSYRTNKHLPPHLRRRTSLETIDSVKTTHSIPSDEDEDEDEDEDALDPLEAAAPQPDFFTPETDGTATPVPSDAHSLESSMPASSISSQQSGNSPNTPTASVDEESHSPVPTKTMFHKIWRKSGGQTSASNRLVIAKTVSVDQTSHHSSNSGSKSSLPSERQDEPGRPNAEQTRSGTSSEWSASEFDASSLTEAELKRCKKKGLNPELFAEMKAARKGKWTSPIAGNTFL